jgi:hypothetical protein
VADLLDGEEAAWTRVAEMIATLRDAPAGTRT